MNPLTSTSNTTAFPASFAGAGPAYSAAPFRARPQAYFGNAAAKAAAQPGKLAILRALGKYYTKGENKQAIKALLWEYGVPIGIGLTALIPVVGWASAIVGIPFAMWSASHGAKLRRALNADGAKGPFLRVAEMKTLYKEATNYNKVKTIEDTRSYSTKITEKLRDFVDELFPDQDDKQIKNLKNAVTRLKPAADGRVHNLIGSSLEVQFNYRQKWAGKLLRGLDKTIGRIKFKPIQMPITALKALFIGVLMLKNRALLRQSLKVVA